MLLLLLYGCDIVFNQFVVVILLLVSQFGVGVFYLVDVDGCCYFCDVGGVDRLVKYSGCLFWQNLFGLLFYLWIYDKVLQVFDLVNCIGWVLL